MANSTPKLSEDESVKLLAKYQNEKTRFLNIARLELSDLFVHGKFREVVKVCDDVLALDPEDIDTLDYKTEAKHFETHPNEFDPSKVFTLDEPAVSKRMQRSVSERRPLRRKAFSLITQQSTPTTNGTSRANGPSANDNEVFDGNNNGPASLEVNGKETPRLQRSQSESAKRPTSVLQKIKRFEAQLEARGPSTTTAKVGLTQSRSFRKQRSQIEEDEVQVDKKPVFQTQRSLSASSAIGLRDAQTSASKIPQSITGNISRPVQDPAKLPADLKPRSPHVTVSGTAFHSLSPPGSDSRVLQSPISSITVSPFNRRAGVKWSAGINVEEELRGKLQHDFFGSDLLTGAVFASLKGDVLGSSGKGTRVTKSELEALTGSMSKRELITSSKVKLGGTEYSCLSATAHIVRARVSKLGLGVNCSIFNTGVVIGLYEEPVLPKPVGKLVQHIGEMLTNYEY